MVKEKVFTARNSPITFGRGFAKDAFDYHYPFDLFIGNSRFRNVNCIVRKANGDEWFTIEPPEASGAPPRISAKFFDINGLPELEIMQNEWLCSTGVWDLKVYGQIIEVFSSHSQRRLRLKAKPPHGIEIQYLNMFF